MSHDDKRALNVINLRLHSVYLVWQFILPTALVLLDHIFGFCKYQQMSRSQILWIFSECYNIHWKSTFCHTHKKIKEDISHFIFLNPRGSIIYYLQCDKPCSHEYLWGFISKEKKKKKKKNQQPPRAGSEHSCLMECPYLLQVHCISLLAFPLLHC